MGGMLLECTKCRHREVIDLTNFEARVFRANQYIYHTCNYCGGSTIWSEAAYEPTEARGRTPSPAPGLPPELAPAPRTSNRRRHNRVRCGLRACIHYIHNYEDEILEVNDVSRGGVSFTTQKCLTPGARIEIAVPYSPGMPNIFLPAEIVRIKPLPNSKHYVYGAAYLKGSIAKH